VHLLVGSINPHFMHCQSSHLCKLNPFILFLSTSSIRSSHSLHACPPPSFFRQCHNIPLCNLLLAIPTLTATHSVAKVATAIFHLSHGSQIKFLQSHDLASLYPCVLRSVLRQPLLYNLPDQPVSSFNRVMARAIGIHREIRSPWGRSNPLRRGLDRERSVSNAINLT
jgi:hypothetical protein